MFAPAYVLAHLHIEASVQAKCVVLGVMQHTSFSPSTETRDTPGFRKHAPSPGKDSSPIVTCDRDGQKEQGWKRGGHDVAGTSSQNKHRSTPHAAAAAGGNGRWCSDFGQGSCIGETEQARPVGDACTLTLLCKHNKTSLQVGMKEASFVLPLCLFSLT